MKTKNWSITKTISTFYLGKRQAAETCILNQTFYHLGAWAQLRPKLPNKAKENQAQGLHEGARNQLPTFFQSAGKDSCIQIQNLFDKNQANPRATLLAKFTVSCRNQAQVSHTGG